MSADTVPSYFAVPKHPSDRERENGNESDERKEERWRGDCGEAKRSRSSKERRTWRPVSHSALKERGTVGKRGWAGCMPSPNPLPSMAMASKLKRPVTSLLFRPERCVVTFLTVSYTWWAFWLTTVQGRIKGEKCNPRVKVEEKIERDNKESDEGWLQCEMWRGKIKECIDDMSDMKSW